MAVLSEQGSAGTGGTEGRLPRGRRLLRQFLYPARWGSLAAAVIPVLLVFPGLSLSYVAWFALVPALVLFARAATAREAIARGWWFGAGYLISMLSWMAPQIGPGLLVIGGIFGGLWAPFAGFARVLLPSGLPGALRPRPWARFGLALAVLLNVDTVTLAKSLWLDSALRGSAVELATKTVTQGQGDLAQATLVTLQQDLRPLPVGWDPAKGRPDANWYQSPAAIFAKLIGWLITALAISLGAPFWFDLLSKFGCRRASGNKPAPSSDG